MKYRNEPIIAPLSKQGIKFSINHAKKKGTPLSLSAIRFLIAVQKTGIEVIGRRENKARIVEREGLSWQDRLDWAVRMRDYQGRRSEHMEWLTIVYNSEEEARAYMDKKSARVIGEKNPAYGHGGRLSPFSKGSVNYDPTALKRAHDTLNTTKNRPNHVEFHLRKGLGLCQAIAAVKERQATNSLENFIKRHGEIEGSIKWRERQEKWQATLNAKSDEEKAEINRKKISTGYQMSKPEHELFQKLKPHGPPDNFEQSFTLNRDDGKTYVYDMRFGNVVIEYNGDMWHANPDVYDETYVNPVSKKTAPSIWQKDADKKRVVENNDLVLVTVWERDYKSNPDREIKRCIEAFGNHN